LLSRATACPRRRSLSCRGAHRALHSFPTRRSSDLAQRMAEAKRADAKHLGEVREKPSAEAVDRFRAAMEKHGDPLARQQAARQLDRKSTRLNSSHVKISYAVFCLKKKKIETAPG